MLKKIIRMELPWVVAAGLVLPFLSAVAQTDQPKAEKTKPGDGKGKGKGKGKAGKRKAEEPKAQKPALR